MEPDEPAAREARLDRRRVCEHERRAAEQPAARQAWNAAEEQNRLSVVL